MRTVTKKGYEIPEAKIVALLEEDVIHTSGSDNDNWVSDEWDAFVQG